jgi:glycosyltransferase involved in cell wall biosynthesis
MLKSAIISIIVPIYKVEKEIHRCVDSLLKQKFNDIEIILVDDGSPDNCPQICDEYAKLDSRINVFHKENGGLSDARNFGLLRATGKYILFVDSDDYIDVNTCDNFYNHTMDNIDIIVGDALKIEKGKDSLLGHAEIPNNSILRGREFLKIQLKSNKMNMPAWLNMYRKDFLINNGLLFKPGILHEDEQWTPRVFLSAESVKYIKYSFYFYIIRDNSITKRKDRTQNGIDLINTCYELENIYQKVQDKELQELLNDNLVSLFFSAINIGNLYDVKFKQYFKNEFLIGKSKSIKNKLRVLVFRCNKKIYHLLYRLFYNFKKKL